MNEWNAKGVRLNARLNNGEVAATGRQIVNHTNVFSCPVQYRQLQYIMNALMFRIWFGFKRSLPCN